MKRPQAARALRVYRGTRARIGLLGGSFNPAHDGHRYLSLEALRKLKLDAVWWLVSPQNPLKPKAGMAPLKTRLAQAERIANHPRIIPTDIESELGTVYTASTLKALKRLFPHVRFVWLMGADNLAQIHRWDSWQQIFNSVPIAVFARPTYSLNALSGRAAHRFDRYRVKERSAGRLTQGNPPRWVFLHTRLHPASATVIRAAEKGSGKGGNRDRSFGRTRQ